MSADVTVYFFVTTDSVYSVSGGSVFTAVGPPVESSFSGFLADLTEGTRLWSSGFSSSASLGWDIEFTELSPNTSGSLDGNLKEGHLYAFYTGNSIKSSYSLSDGEGVIGKSDVLFQVSENPIKMADDGVSISHLGGVLVGLVILRRRLFRNAD